MDLLPAILQGPVQTDGVLKYFNSRDMFLTDTLEEKKPFTRLKYSDAVKIVYNGKEEQDTVGIRRFRYR